VQAGIALLAVGCPPIASASSPAGPAGPHFFESRAYPQWTPEDPSFDECTIAAISGVASADGRPMIWKNRDTGYQDNEVVHFTDGKYAYLALVGAGETNKAWLGVNERGFAVQNALSYNIADTYNGGITNGALMKLALQNCADIADFEALLLQTNQSGRDNPANLAVLDAHGAVAMFEVGNFAYVRFDANDPDEAPNGILVRANFSLSADTTGLDTWRYRRALSLVEEARSSDGVTAAGLARVARDLMAADCDPYPLPYEGAPPGYPKYVGYVNTRETISRSSTVASGVICGVHPGEDPRLSTFYAFLGLPLITPALPLWVAAGQTPPEVDGPYTAPFCDASRERRRRCYDVMYNPYLLNTWRIIERDPSHGEILSDVEVIENHMLNSADKLLRQWRVDGVDPAAMAIAERHLVERAYDHYTRTGQFASRDLSLDLLDPRNEGGSLGVGTSARSLEIFDIAGRLVASVRPEPGQIETGMSRFAGPVRWDGRRADGSPAPSGVYYGRAPGERHQIARYVIVR